MEYCTRWHIVLTTAPHPTPQGIVQLAQAEYYLGRLYAFGRGVDKDEAQAGGPNEVPGFAAL